MDHNTPLLHKNKLPLSEARDKSSILLAVTGAGKNPVKERDRLKPLHPLERFKWTQSDDDQDENYFAMSECERSMTPVEWIQEHSRHVELLPGQEQQFEDRLRYILKGAEPDVGTILVQTNLIYRA